jgi:hypothetical protein
MASVHYRDTDIRHVRQTKNATPVTQSNGQGLVFHRLCDGLCDALPLLAGGMEGLYVHVINRIITCIEGHKPEPAQVMKYRRSESGKQHPGAGSFE